MSVFREYADQYGRHSLKVAGGDNRQRDVLHVIGEAQLLRFAIHPTRINAEYVGVHSALDGYVHPTDTRMVRWVGYDWWLERPDKSTVAVAEVSA